jgi:segregation and condensation protein B
VEWTDDIASALPTAEMTERDAAESSESNPRELPAEPDPEAAAPVWPEDQLDRAVAALLFASSEPLSNARIAAVLEHTTPAHVAAALDRVSARLVASGLPFELVAIAGGWQMFSARDMADVVARCAKVRREEKVSPAALETLAVVAYRQPVTKAEIEAVRGVQVGPILRALVDRGLVKVAGRSEDPGHALLYVTTRKFLDTFGLADLADLPRDAELVRDS